MQPTTSDSTQPAATNFTYAALTAVSPAAQVHTCDAPA